MSDKTKQTVKLTADEYRALRVTQYVTQGGRCAGCADLHPIHKLALHHKAGRGIGGGFRRDTEEDTEMLCGECHPEADKQKESKFGLGQD